MSGASMFQKTAADMIKGVRAHPRDEASYIAVCITEIKEELKSTMQGTKQQAVLKLVYLEMMGYDVSWASFHFVDVMSFPRFRAKRIGFLAAQQCFHESTDVLLLTTNLFRRTFASSSPHEVCLGIHALAKIATCGKTSMQGYRKTELAVLEPTKPLPNRSWSNNSTT